MCRITIELLHEVLEKGLENNSIKSYSNNNINALRVIMHQKVMVTGFGRECAPLVQWRFV